MTDFFTLDFCPPLYLWMQKVHDENENAKFFYREKNEQTKNLSEWPKTEECTAYVMLILYVICLMWI